MKNNKCTCNDPSTFMMDKHDEAYMHKCPHCISLMWEAVKPTLKGVKGSIIMCGSSSESYRMGFMDLNKYKQ